LDIIGFFQSITVVVIDKGNGRNAVGRTILQEQLFKEPSALGQLVRT